MYWFPRELFKNLQSDLKDVLKPWRRILGTLAGRGGLTARSPGTYCSEMVHWGWLSEGRVMQWDMAWGLLVTVLAPHWEDAAEFWGFFVLVDNHNVGHRKYSQKDTEGKNQIIKPFIYPTGCNEFSGKEDSLCHYHQVPHSLTPIRYRWYLGCQQQLPLTAAETHPPR